jgi:hypothetical protein
MFPTVFAARALANAGIMVLQVDDGVCPMTTPQELSCASVGYRGAINALVAEGKVDASRVGIVGFSRTCLYVMEAITTDPLLYRAALIADGLMYSFTQFVYLVDSHGGTPTEATSVIGGLPYGDGLRYWLSRSPTFQLDRITAPLMVVAYGRPHAMLMWEPYAGLRFLHKPTDFLLVNSTEHVLRNPATRLASQGRTVDWFRFWLKGEDDPNPAKVEMYIRWKSLGPVAPNSGSSNRASFEGMPSPHP